MPVLWHLVSLLIATENVHTHTRYVEVKFYQVILFLRTVPEQTPLGTTGPAQRSAGGKRHGHQIAQAQNVQISPREAGMCPRARLVYPPCSSIVLMVLYFILPLMIVLGSPLL